MDKVISAKLHSGVFCSGVNLGTDLSIRPGAKQVELEMQGSFLKVSKGDRSILVPFTNVQQIELEKSAVKAK